MKKHRKVKPFLEELRKVPNISVACERIGISRNTLYRWMQEDKDFAKEVEEAHERGIESVNDLAESKLIQLINSGSLQAIKLWLGNNKKNYRLPRPPEPHEAPRGDIIFNFEPMKKRLKEIKEEQEKEKDNEDPVFQ